ncbi:hypothetical protein ID866_10858 [Astraeus odoratus]|nr:hypothetical protein ID866_10858 [Astraeus odoratus]
MTTCCQAALQAATSSHRRSSAVVVDQFRSFSACHASAASSHSQLSQHTPTPVPQSTSAHATVPQTPTQPQTPSNLGNPGDPGDDSPDNGDNPFIGNNDEGKDDLQGNELTMLAQAIQNLACMSRCNLDSGSSSSQTKVQEPDTFNGSDLKKLCMFLVQSKVTFAQSYLKGMALQWFEPKLLSDSDPDDCPLWMDDWKEFIIELQMKESQCINKYVVEFNHIASQLQGYRDGALHHHFYTGLPDHIKDEICHIGKPWTLGELHLLAQEVDAHC